MNTQLYIKSADESIIVIAYSKSDWAARFLQQGTKCD